MKWPNQLVIVRHGESRYNELKLKKEKSQLYQSFLAEYEKVVDWRIPLPKDLIELGKAVANEFSLKEVDDYRTPMTEEGRNQARKTGESLKKLITLPDVIFVSPFLRTVETLKCMIESWSELGNIKTYQEERIREKNPGLALLYNDFRVFYVLHPEQRRYYDLLGDLGGYWYNYPNGENVPQVRDRIRLWVATLIREFARKRVLAISHHITKLAVRANLERLGPEEFVALDRNEKPINCGVTIYQGEPRQGVNGKLVLNKYNQKIY